MKKSLLYFLFLFLTCSFSHAAVIPVQGEKYYILQTFTKSGKVVSASQFNEVVLDHPTISQSQVFEFIPVANKSDTYFVKNQQGYYLTNSMDVQWLTEYTEEPEGEYSEWIIEGNNLNNIRLKVKTSAYFASAEYNAGSFLYADKTVTDLLGNFKLVSQSQMIQNNLIDPGFENAVVEGTPLGVWQNNGNKTFGNDNATTQNYRSRIVSNGYQVSGNNAFIARFYGDENSYTKLSYQLGGLIKGATYTFAFKSKQGNDNAAEAKVFSYITLLSGDEQSNAISNVFTSTSPASTATTQTPGNVLLTFTATSTTCYVNWEKNKATVKNYLYYIDDMVLTKTADPTPAIFTLTKSLNFDATNRTFNLQLSGIMLTDSIRITAPDGISLSRKTLPANSSSETVKVSFTGFSSLDGSITLTSNDVSLQIPVVASYNTAFVQPITSEKYYIQQRTGGKVIANSGSKAVLKYAEKNDNGQIFSVENVNNKLNTYYLKSDNNQYLTFNESKLVYNAQPSINSEWVLQGTSDSLIYITQSQNSASVVGSDSAIHNSTLYADKFMTAPNSAFALLKVSAVVSPYMFDPGFENHPTDAGPLGTWIPAVDGLQLGTYGFSRVQNSAWASAGKKCMYLRFLGDATSYNSISQKLHSLNAGATYRLDLKYKCQSTAATSLVNIYAAAVPNASTSAAIGGIYSTTSVAASNLSSQSAQSTSITFVAPSSTAWIVYSKNTTATNFNFFIDDLMLTETKPSALEKTFTFSDFNASFVGDVLNIKFVSLVSENAKIQLFNLQGQQVVFNDISIESGSNSFTLPVSVQAGVYLIRISDHSGMSTIKVLK